MEVEYSTQKKLGPMLMEWVNGSRMKDHLLPNCYFIMFSQNILSVHLSHLSEEYKNKHVLPDINAYSLSLFNHLLPTIKSWCMQYDIWNIDLQLWFHCEDHKYRTTRTVILSKDDKDYREYLENKST